MVPLWVLLGIIVFYWMTVAIGEIRDDMPWRFSSTSFLLYSFIGLIFLYLPVTLISCLVLGLPPVDVILVTTVLPLGMGFMSGFDENNPKHRGLIIREPSFDIKFFLWHIHCMSGSRRNSACHILLRHIAIG